MALAAQMIDVIDFIKDIRCRATSEINIINQKHLAEPAIYISRQRNYRGTQFIIIRTERSEIPCEIKVDDFDDTSITFDSIGIPRNNISNLYKLPSKLDSLEFDVCYNIENLYGDVKKVRHLILRDSGFKSLDGCPEIKMINIERCQRLKNIDGLKNTNVEKIYYMGMEDLHDAKIFYGYDSFNNWWKQTH